MITMDYTRHIASNVSEYLTLKALNSKHSTWQLASLYSGPGSHSARCQLVLSGLTEVAENITSAITAQGTGNRLHSQYIMETVSMMDVLAAKAA